MKKLLISLFLILLIIPLHAQKTLTLEVFISTCLKNHPFSKINEAEYMAALKKNQAVEGIKDWNLFLSYSYGEGMENQFTMDFDKDTKLSQFNLTGSKLISEFGTRLELGTSYTSVENITAPFPGFPTEYYRYSYDISIKQPLLKNAFGAMDRFPLQVAKYYQKIAKIKYQEDFEDFIVSITNDFLNWRLSFTKLKIYKLQLKKAEKQVALFKRQFKRGASEKLDLVQVKQNLSVKKLQLLEEQANHKNLTRKIVYLMAGKSITKNPAIMPSDKAVAIPSKAKNYTLSYINKNSNIEKLLGLNEKIQLETFNYFQNNQFHQLDIVAQTTFPSTALTNSDAQKGLGEDSNYVIGIEYALPVSNTKEKNNFEEASAILKKVQAENENTRITINHKTNNIWEHLDNLNSLIKESLHLVKLSKESARLENKKYQQGRSSLYFVLTAEDRFLISQLQLQNLFSQKAVLKNQLANINDLYIDRYLEPPN